MNQVREGDAPQDHRRHAHHGGGANGEPVSIDHAARGLSQLAVVALQRPPSIYFCVTSSRRSVTFRALKRVIFHSLDRRSVIFCRRSVTFFYFRKE
jgi:hypothetical protein